MKKYALIGAILALSLGGCTPKIDGEKAEAAIKTGFKTQTGQELKTLTCPRDVVAKANATFPCKGQTTDGTDVVITVTIKDEAGNVAWEVTSVGGQTGSAAPTPEGQKAAPAAEPKEDHKE